MTLEKAIEITIEHMSTCEEMSEEYQVLEILLKCANICKGTIKEFSQYSK